MSCLFCFHLSFLFHFFFLFVLCFVLFFLACFVLFRLRAPKVYIRHLQRRNEKKERFPRTMWHDLSFVPFSFLRYLVFFYVFLIVSVIGPVSPNSVKRRHTYIFCAFFFLFSRWLMLSQLPRTPPYYHDLVRSRLLFPVFFFCLVYFQVVFATETLAAGVNMPARATVITTLSKRIDTGIVKLTPSQLLQMGGRCAYKIIPSPWQLIPYSICAMSEVFTQKDDSAR